MDLHVPRFDGVHRGLESRRRQTVRIAGDVRDGCIETDSVRSAGRAEGAARSLAIVLDDPYRVVVRVLRRVGRCDMAGNSRLIEIDVVTDDIAVYVRIYAEDFSSKVEHSARSLATFGVEGYSLREQVDDERDVIGIIL